MKGTEIAVECSRSGLEKVLERRQKVKVAAEKEKAEKVKKDRMWKELLEQKRRERKAWVGKQLDEEMNIVDEIVDELDHCIVGALLMRLWKLLLVCLRAQLIISM